jgi:hypothetical protein
MIFGREAPARGEAIGGWRRGRFVILVPGIEGVSGRQRCGWRLRGIYHLGGGGAWAGRRSWV